MAITQSITDLFPNFKKEEAVSDLNGRILATLSIAELHLLNFFVLQGRKYGIEVKFTNEDKSQPILQNIDYQFQQLINGNHNLPIYNENVIVSIVHT